MPSQLRLRHVRVESGGRTRRVSFVFPFFDPHGWITFCLVSGWGGEFVTDAKLRWTRRRLVLWSRGPEPLVPLADVQPGDFAGLLHFDPWWTMRNASGVPAPLREAIIATNIAGRRSGHLRVRDLLVSDEFDRIAQFWIGDGVFRPARYARVDPVPPVLRRELLSPVP